MYHIYLNTINRTIVQCTNKCTIVLEEDYFTINDTNDTVVLLHRYLLSTITITTVLCVPWYLVPGTALALASFFSVSIIPVHVKQ